MKTITSKKPRVCKGYNCHKQIRANNRSGYCTGCGLDKRAEEKKK